MGASVSAGDSASTVAKATGKTLADFEAPDIDGKLVKFSSLKDKVVLVVNVASK